MGLAARLIPRYSENMSAEERASLAEIVSIDKDIMHGTPCFTGTRVPVQTLLDYLEGGETIEQFFSDFPRVRREQAVQFLQLAKQQLLACVSS
jgi:uncharacterized protein (DUF433 family)